MPAINGLQIPTFADVAELILPNGGPAWLPAHLEWWSQGVSAANPQDIQSPETRGIALAQ
jgi:hypothetical protein